MFRPLLLSGGNGRNRTGLAWADGRGFVGSEARFVSANDCSSAELTVNPSGLAGDDVESDPIRLQDRTGLDRVITALGWSEPRRH